MLILARYKNMKIEYNKEILDVYDHKYSYYFDFDIMHRYMLESFKSRRHIVNLGHGVYPDVDPEKVKTFIKTVKSYEIQY